MAAQNRAAAAKAKAEAVLEEIEQICPECFPHGWRHIPAEHEAVACPHGGWARPEPATPETPVPPTGGTDPETTPKEPTS